MQAQMGALTNMEPFFCPTLVFGRVIADDPWLINPHFQTKQIQWKKR
jgi:hypothetical protein